MKYGILKVGDVVKFNWVAKEILGDLADNDEHVVAKIDVSDGLDDIDDEDTLGNEHAEWDGSSGADVFWLDLVRKAEN